MRARSALLLFLMLGLGCKHCEPIPTPAPLADCPDTGRMMRAEGLIYGIYDCYSCELASRCFTEGAQYCCSGAMCAECSPSPVRFNKANQDLGPNTSKETQ